MCLRAQNAGKFMIFCQPQHNWFELTDDGWSECGAAGFFACDSWQPVGMRSLKLFIKRMLEVEVCLYARKCVCVMFFALTGPLLRDNTWAIKTKSRDGSLQNVSIISCSNFLSTWKCNRLMRLYWSVYCERKKIKRLKFWGNFSKGRNFARMRPS